MIQAKAKTRLHLKNKEHGFKQNKNTVTLKKQRTWVKQNKHKKNMSQVKQKHGYKKQRTWVKQNKNTVTPKKQHLKNKQRT